MNTEKNTTSDFLGKQEKEKRAAEMRNAFSVEDFFEDELENRRDMGEGQKNFWKKKFADAKEKDKKTGKQENAWKIFSDLKNPISQLSAKKTGIFHDRPHLFQKNFDFKDNASTVEAKVPVAKNEGNAYNGTNENMNEENEMMMQRQAEVMMAEERKKRMAMIQKKQKITSETQAQKKSNIHFLAKWTAIGVGGGISGMFGMGLL